MTVKFWVGDSAGNGNWTDPSAWSTGSIPQSDDIAAVLTKTGGTIVAQDISIDGQVLLDRSSNPPLVLDMQGGASIGKTGFVTTVGDGGPAEISLHDTPLYGVIQNAFGELNITIDENTSGVNYGRIAASTTQGNAHTVINADKGFFGNSGALQAAVGGTLELQFGGSYPTPDQIVWNTGVIEAGAGGIVSIKAAHAFIEPFGDILNIGTLRANGGLLEVNADMVQDQAAVVEIKNGGTVQLDGGHTDGGTIKIEHGMLEFGLYDRSGVPAPIAAHQSSTWMEFTGTAATDTASIKMGNAPDIQAAYDEATRDLTVTMPYQDHPMQIGKFHMTGDIAYHASDFRADGPTSTVIYTPHQDA